MAHYRPKNGELVEVGRIQLLLQTIYAKYEPQIIRVLDVTLRLFSKLRAKPILMVLSRMLGRFLPTAEVVTLEQATDFIDAISGLENTQLALGPCRCQEVLGKRKGTYMKDLVILYGAEAYKRASDKYKDLSPEKAKKLLRELNQEGLIPTFYACMGSGGWIYAICGCESEICFPFRSHVAAGAVLNPGPDIVALDRESCTSCGKCVERCHFGANSLANPTAEIDLTKCYGCGLCVSTCSGGARSMVKREGYRNRYYPIDLVSRASAH
jgi:ferredoxin